jgi:hypothetical protein
VSSTPPTPPDGNVFQMLHAVADALRSGDIDPPSRARPHRRRVETISRAQVEMGARAKQVDEVSMRNAAGRRST